ncbi:hypothetical protein OC861_005215 [Tilletia horrida]|nr:hypothetical protein OC861_005215 [Tilletia horrida]
MDGRGQQKPAGKGNQANNKIRTAPVSEAQQSLNSLAQVAAFCDVQQAVTSEAGPSGPKRKKAKLGHSKDLTTLAHKTVSSLSDLADKNTSFWAPPASCVHDVPEL